MTKQENDEERYAYAETKGEHTYERRADVLRHQALNENQFFRQQAHREIDWLSQLAASLRNLHGRTQIVFLSEGFEARAIEGRAAREWNEADEDAELVMRGQWYKIDNDQRFGSSASLTVLEAMGQAFRGSGVILQAIDLRGLRTQPDLSRAPEDNNEGLFLLARPTGGEVFRNTNDLTGSFARMLHQQEVVYVLGFQAPVVNPGKLHELKVGLSGGPRGASLFYRRGYFEGGTASTPLERTLAAADIIVRDVPQDDIHIAALAAAFPGDDGSAQVPATSFPFADFKRSAPLMPITTNVSKVGSKLRENGVKYLAMLQLPPGKYAVKTLVRTPATEQDGYARIDIVVPKSGQTVLLPPFVLDDPQAWLIVRGAQHGGEASFPFHINGQPFVPSASGRPPAGAVRKVAVFVCNAAPEELSWETTPPAALLAQVKSVAATKLVLQLDQGTLAEGFGITVRKRGAPVPLSATTLLTTH